MIGCVLKSMWRRAPAIVAGLILSAAAASAQVPGTGPVPGKVSVTTANGYARLVFRFRDQVATEAQVAGSILIVAFRQPVAVDVDRLNAEAPDYISAARLDPDGRAVRIALARKVDPNLMPAGEQVFLDLLPDTWKGLKPALPQAVVDDLARRLEIAEKQARLRQQVDKWKKTPPIRIQVAQQPTFTRYVFPLTDNIAVASNLGKDALTLSFDAPIRFDLADAIVMLPPFLTKIEPKLDGETASVRFSFNGKVDVRSFREDNNYIVDLSNDAATQARGDPISRVLEAAQHSDVAASPSVPKAHTPQTVPAVAAPQTAGEQASVLKPSPPPKAPAPIEAAAPAVPAPQPAAAAPRPAVAANPPPAQPPMAAPVEKAPPPPPAVLAAKKAATPPAKPAAKAAAAQMLPAPPRALKAALKQQQDSVRLLFPFTAPTPAAVFRRAGVLWLVFDSDAKIDLGAIRSSPDGMIREVVISHLDALVIRLKLDRPRLASIAADGAGWAVTIGDRVADPTQPITIGRSMVGPHRATVHIPFTGARRLHRLSDPQSGDTLLVVTALAPARGLLKRQDFVEFHALATVQGIAVAPLADDILVQIELDRVVISRPGGLALSPPMYSNKRAAGEGAQLFDPQQWAKDSDGNFFARQSELVNAAAAAPADHRSAKHVELARFYMARGFYPEAKGAMDMALGGEHPKSDEAHDYVLRAVAEAMSRRPAEALKDLSQPTVGGGHEAPLWRALAYAEQNHWVQARDGFMRSRLSMATLPAALQRFVLRMSIRASLEVGDYQSAGDQLNDFETIGVPENLRPAIEVLRGRIAEKLGRTQDALADYELVTGSIDRQASTQARLRETILRLDTGVLKPDAAIPELETISVIWRGDETEIEALQVLARLYTKKGRIRDALNVMRAAMAANARSDLTRRIQDEAAATFESLFLSDKSEALPAIDALSLFYDFRDLTPMGRRGDEMIRRLADRLVSVDLLDQAAELLQHQVDHRLEGAARAQVATRLAMIYLMSHKADRALTVLRATQVAGLPDTTRNLRLLLEARAMSELARPDVALEIVANIPGREAERLRADILWKAQRWRQAGEQIERMLGDRWRDWQPLDAVERTDVLRAGISYALGDESIGLGRLRERYAAKMSDTPDSHAFDVVTGPLGVSSAEFRNVASAVAGVDTLDGFLHDMRAGFPDLGSEPDGKRRKPPATISGSAPALPAKPAT